MISEQRAYIFYAFISKKIRENSRKQLKVQYLISIWCYLKIEFKCKGLQLLHCHLFFIVKSLIVLLAQSQKKNQCQFADIGSPRIFW